MFHPAISTKKRSGFIIIAVSLVITALLFMAGYMVEQSISETRISKSENSATKAYYVAEAGVNNAIYLLKNDSTWKNGFLAGTLNNISSSQNSVFSNAASYEISATSISPGVVDITTTGYFTIGNKQSKRQIKTRLARATGNNTEWEQSVYTGGGGGNNGFLNVERDCSATGGTLHANQNFKVKKATLDVYDGIVSSSNNIIENAGGQIILHNSTQQEDVDDIDMPSLDIDSSSPTSLKNRANQTYTATAFANLASGTILNGITFVSGNAVWTNKNLTINGILAASGDITINLSSNKTITVNSSASGSGLASKGTITITLNSSSTATINGLIYGAYATNYAITNSTFSLTGGSITYRTNFTGSGGSCSLVYDNNLVITPLDPVLNGSESPIIEVNHWEEQY